MLGHPYGANAERGVFRSSDGGQHWEKVLYKDEDTGGCDVEIDPSDPNVVYAGMGEACMVVRVRMTVWAISGSVNSVLSTAAAAANAGTRRAAREPSS